MIEQNAMLGGMGTSGLITMVMTSRKYFYGFGKNLINTLISEGGARFIEKPSVGGYNYFPFDGEAMKRRLDALVAESGAKLLLYTKIIGLKKEGSMIKENLPLPVLSTRSL